ncbi:MAG: methionyl-tRNA formyltransferase [Oscillospiraceae bacterium]|nr:methionyl-tRNA formyltransferase [Oscillospiraceae bacterium]
MRIAFMGTPDFAVASLRRLVEDGHEIVGVFTQPDKPGNRKKITPPPVKDYALTVGLKVYQPEKMRGEEQVDLLRSLSPELTVVAAYGQILPEDILSIPTHGSINVHASLLPKYRGAAPINRAILNGEKETGVSIMYMAKKLDAGDVISARKLPILPEDNAITLFEKLALLGAELLSDTIVEIGNGTAGRTPQNEEEATYAAMLSRELSPIDWSNSSQTILDQIRALVPWPVASTTADGKLTKVWSAVLGNDTSDIAGSMRANKRGIEVACGDGKSIIITTLQREGGSRVSGEAWFNGRRTPVGTLLE